jgi:hypothetical protein
VNFFQFCGVVKFKEFQTFKVPKVFNKNFLKTATKAQKSQNFILLYIPFSSVQYQKNSNIVTKVITTALKSVQTFFYLNLK